MRILITGSRNWRDRHAIAIALRDYLRGAPADPPVVIVHGSQCTEDRKTGELYGADYLSDEVALTWGFDRDPHPADWDRYGKRAGPIRNQAMVDLGANVCLAFPLGESRGTRDCMRRAEAAGIPVINFGDELS